MDRETADEIKRHFDVVAAGLRSEIRIVDEKGDRRSEDLERRFDVTAEGLRSDMAVSAEDLRSEIRAVDEKGDRRFDDLKGHFDVVAEGLRSDMQGVKRHFDVVAEGLRSDIRLVAEGVAGLDEKFTREFVTVREEIRDQIGEVKSLIRVSYGDLDRRVPALEKPAPS